MLTQIRGGVGEEVLLAICSNLECRVGRCGLDRGLALILCKHERTVSEVSLTWPA